jgi:hypothetical protein
VVHPEPSSFAGLGAPASLRINRHQPEMDNFGSSMTLSDSHDGGQQSGLRLSATNRFAFSPQAEQQIIRAMDKNKFNTILIVRILLPF